MTITKKRPSRGAEPINAAVSADLHHYIMSFVRSGLGSGLSVHPELLPRWHARTTKIGQ